jgi:DNA-directed RNA polymerase subunit M/transcription elongation factor TFIIS
MEEFPFGIPHKFYINKNYNDIRRSKLKLIYTIFNQDMRFRNNITWKEQVAIGEAIEKCFYREVIEKSDISNIRKDWGNRSFLTMYNSISYKVICNLDKKSLVGSQYLLNEILDGKINLGNITKMTPYELSPASNAKLIKEIESISQYESKKRYSTLHQCGNCKKYTCVTENRYNRGLDEGSNLIIICVTCGHTCNG